MSAARNLAWLAVVPGVLGLAAPAHAATPTSCATGSKRVGLVICVDLTTSTAWATDRKGNRLLDLGTITGSLADSDGAGSDDYLTPVGTWRVTCIDDLTGDGDDPCNPVSNGLESLIQFENGTAWNTSIHGYRSSRIGAGWDSHGCVRSRKPIARELFAQVLAVREGGLRVLVSVFKSGGK